MDKITGLWGVVLDLGVGLGALVGVASLIPGLRRVIKRKTADGVSVALCGMGLVSYFTWLALAKTHDYYMILIIITSSSLYLIQYYYVCKWTKTPIITRILWVVIAMVFGVGAFIYPWLGLMVVIFVDFLWYFKAIKDIKNSVKAEAVSYIGQAIVIIPNLSWVISSLWAKNYKLAAHTGALAIMAAILSVYTYKVQKTREVLVK
jgi:hypothetical protein